MVSAKRSCPQSASICTSKLMQGMATVWSFLCTGLGGERQQVQVLGFSLLLSCLCLDVFGLSLAGFVLPRVYLSRLIVGNRAESTSTVHGRRPGLRGKRQAVGMRTPVGRKERESKVMWVCQNCWGVVQSLISSGFS